LKHDCSVDDANQLTDLDVSFYSLELPVSASSPVYSQGSGLCFQLGEPITVYWTAPKDHSELDWIGIYKATANPSKTVTTTSSRGRWKYLREVNGTTGTCIFDGDSLPWEVGVYEFRLHHKDRHIVLAFTELFEIKGKGASRS
jgi:phosphatidylethanolamine N-methyltransferase